MQSSIDDRGDDDSVADDSQIDAGEEEMEDGGRKRAYKDVRDAGQAVLLGGLDEERSTRRPFRKG
jgi:hypothetical protein